MTADVQNAPDRNRYEITQDGRLAGYAEYQLVRGDRIVFTHTEIDPDFGGQGLGTVLVAGALEDARDRELQIVPICPFVAKYVHENPEFLP
ncbi:MAG: GNAT family N-acetyltransferase, partial [Patulibacter sp.]